MAKIWFDDFFFWKYLTFFKDILEELIDVDNTWIAKGGNMSLTNVEEFVKVIHEDYSKKEKFVSIANTLLSNNKVIHTCQVPSHLHVEVTYSQTSNIYRYLHSSQIRSLCFF